MMQVHDVNYEALEKLGDYGLDYLTVNEAASLICKCLVCEGELDPGIELEVVSLFDEDLEKAISKDIQTMAERLITGSGQPQITGDIKKHKFKLPHPDEQHKIADFLSAIDEKITLVAQELELAKQFKKGLLQQMFV